MRATAAAFIGRRIQKAFSPIIASGLQAPKKRAVERGARRGHRGVACGSAKASSFPSKKASAERRLRR
jgi:hypothetical protein